MSRIRPSQPTTQVGGPRGVLCPYCGVVSLNPKRCDRCGGHFDPLSRQATQNAMGPWFIRDMANATRPGCSFETLRDLIRRGKVTRETILRGPTTRQFWNFAGRTPSVANLLGVCHNCHIEVGPEDYACRGCGAVFAAETDRQHLGLAPVHLLPGQAPAEIIAAASVEGEKVERATAKAEERVERVQEAGPVTGMARGGPRRGGQGVVFAVVGIVVGAAAATVVFLSPLMNGKAGDGLTRTAGPQAAPEGLEATEPPPALSPTGVVETPVEEPAAVPTGPAGKDEEVGLGGAGEVALLRADLIRMLDDGNTDRNAAMARIRAAAERDAAVDEGVWGAWWDRRVEQLRLRRLP